jgi:hypothetical protein
MGMVEASGLPRATPFLGDYQFAQGNTFLAADIDNQPNR